MKIVPIFANEIDGIPKGLFSVSFDGKPEHNAFMSFIEWMEDTEKMTSFFTETHRQQALQFGFYSPTTISEAIERTRREADALLTQFEEDHETGIEQLIAHLEKIFKPLNNITSSGHQIHPTKTRGNDKGLSKHKKYWIRIYALKIDHGCYVVTGGSVKLFKSMDEDPALQEQKAKLLRAKDFFREEGIYDAHGIEELIIEL